MYIKTAIEASDRLYPNEYTIKEKYLWCDEVGAMLAQEYLKKYDRVTLEPDENGEYLLPEDVSFEMIDRVFVNGTQIDKKDFRGYGILYLSGLRERIALPDKSECENIDVVYLMPYEPIRDISVLGEKIYPSDTYFELASSPFAAGDIVTIKRGITKTAENVLILDIERGKRDRHIVQSGAISALKDSVSGSYPPEGWDVDITREVMDKTLSPAPYDSMYIDYINAKICQYQQNFNVYNQHMKDFNAKLTAYALWLKERDALPDDGKIKNWW